MKTCVNQWCNSVKLKASCSALASGVYIRQTTHAHGITIKYLQCLVFRYCNINLFKYITLQFQKRNRDQKVKKPCKQVNNQKTIETRWNLMVVIEQKLTVAIPILTAR